MTHTPALVRTTRWQLPDAARRALIFGTAGASGLVVNSLLLWLLVSQAGIGYLIAAALATQGSTTWNFIWVERLAFAAHRTPGAWRRYVQFALMNNTAMLLRLPLLGLLTSALGIHYVVSNALTLILIFVVRFALSDRLIWAAHPPKPSAPGTLHGPHPLGRDIASLGLTMLGRKVPEGDLVRHVYREAGVELPADLQVPEALVQRAAMPGDIVVVGSETGLQLARGTILQAAGGLVRMRRLDDAELARLRVLHLEALPGTRRNAGRPEGA